MKIWAITVRSESGDDFGAILFDGKPTEDEVEQALRDTSPDDWLDGDGPGFRGSYLHVDGPHEQGLYKTGAGRRKE